MIRVAEQRVGKGDAEEEAKGLLNERLRGIQPEFKSRQ